MSVSPGENQVDSLECSALLTHHWLVRVRGGEKVLEACAELLPDAPVYTLVHDPSGIADSPLAGREIHTSCLQRLPGATRHYPKLLPLHPWAARRMKLPPAELVLCSDAALAKAMTPDRTSKLVCYCHSPMRYVWDLSAEYRRTLPAILRPLWPALCRRLRAVDRRAAERVDLFIANSRHVADRIRRHYGRDALVIHPPVDVPPAPPSSPPQKGTGSEPAGVDGPESRVPRGACTPLQRTASAPREGFFLCVGYHTPYKRLDLAVAACGVLGRKLVVIGTGPDVERVAARRERHVELLGWQSADVINDHLTRAAALLFPGEEDFGIVPVEAMAHGCPVVAYGVGGATESVSPGRTGILFERQTVDCLVEAMKRCTATTFDPQSMHQHAQKFSKQRFLREMRAALLSVL